jgi:hypothetical protein
VNITAQDRKTITDYAKKVTRKNRIRIEIRRCWIEAEDAQNPNPAINYDASTFNIHGACFKDIDDNYSYRYNYSEFAKHSKDDPRCKEHTVMLDILVGVWDGYDFEAGDWIYPVFENGKLIGFYERGYVYRLENN